MDNSEEELSITLYRVVQHLNSSRVAISYELPGVIAIAVSTTYGCHLYHKLQHRSRSKLPGNLLSTQRKLSLVPRKPHPDRPRLGYLNPGSTVKLLVGYRLFEHRHETMSDTRANMLPKAREFEAPGVDNGRTAWCVPTQANSRASLSCSPLINKTRRSKPSLRLNHRRPQVHHLTAHRPRARLVLEGQLIRSRFCEVHTPVSCAKGPGQNARRRVPVQTGRVGA